MMNVSQPMPVCKHDPAALFPPVATVPTPATYPEAPCSINGYAHVEGYAKDFQVTGRGATGPEAAHNLKASVDALHAAFAPPVLAPVPLKTRLADVLACGIAKAVSKGDWDRITRLSGAAALVLSGAVCEAAMPDRWTVLSRTQAGVAWDVNSAGECGCKDYKHRATEDNHFYCAHGLAVLMQIKLSDTDQAAT
jgi:hypothetical protein